MAYNNSAEALLRARIAADLGAGASSDQIALLWKGYLTGIFLDAPYSNFCGAEYEEFIAMLPATGDEEQHIMFIDPETIEERQEALQNYREESGERRSK